MANTYVNKVIYAGDTLIDLTSDTVTAADVLSGKSFHLKSGEQTTGTCTYDAYTSDADAAASEILLNKTAYVSGSKITGSMPNRGAVTGTISTKDQVYTIANGYHDGSGTICISDVERAKLIETNIRQGITILGVEGSMSGTEDVTAEAATVTPSSTQQVITPGTGYNYLSQVTVYAIPYTETDNASGGVTVTIGSAA